MIIPHGGQSWRPVHNVCLIPCVSKLGATGILDIRLANVNPVQRGYSLSKGR